MVTDRNRFRRISVRDRAAIPAKEPALPSGVLLKRVWWDGQHKTAENLGVSRRTKFGGGRPFSGHADGLIVFMQENFTVFALVRVDLAVCL